MSPYESPAKRGVSRAAALRYQPGSPNSAPVVVASGLGYTAEKIVEIAQENQVPVYQDDSLATILAQFRAGSEIPPELYQAIVEIYLYFLKMAPSKEGMSSLREALGQTPESPTSTD